MNISFVLVIDHPYGDPIKTIEIIYLLGIYLSSQESTILKQVPVIRSQSLRHIGL